VRLLACGDVGVLLEVDEVDDRDAADAVAALAAPPSGLVDVVPGARTVLVRIDPQVTTVAAAIPALAAVDVVALDAPAAGTITIPVTYDGEDLAEVADRTGLGVDGVVAAHTGTPWRVGFVGFAPGFAYLVGGDPRLRVPRRAEPRRRVPAGAVALAGSHAGVYPRPSPGGWQLIGRTDAVLWDLDRDPPALLQPGAVVRFTAV
jgi:KipI family sensor histidine kinase inhibitor